MHLFKRKRYITMQLKFSSFEHGKKMAELSCWIMLSMDLPKWFRSVTTGFLRV